MRALGRSCGSRSRSQLTLSMLLPAVHVFSRCPFRPWTATMLNSYQLLSAQPSSEAYSTIGLVPSHTTCTPCAAVAAGSDNPEDTEDSSAGACLGVRPYEMQRDLEDIPSLCSSSSGSQGAVASRYLRLPVGQQVRGVGRRTSRTIAHESCRKAVARLSCTASAACCGSRRWMAPNCCCRWLSVAQPAQPANPAERR
jgi:hypothetical protein